MTNLRRFLSPDEPEGDVGVLLELDVDEPDEDTLAALRELGLHVTRAVKNKLIGTAPASSFDALENHPKVRRIERSVELRSH